jgi:hypothetical protein
MNTGSTPEPDEEEFLPCPYCGKRPTLVGDDASYFQVQCDTFACGGRYTLFRRRKAALRAWNKRYVPAAVAATTALISLEDIVRRLDVIEKRMAVPMLDPGCPPPDWHRDRCGTLVGPYGFRIARDGPTCGYVLRRYWKLSGCNVTERYPDEASALRAAQAVIDAKSKAAEKLLPCPACPACGGEAWEGDSTSCLRYCVDCGMVSLPSDWRVPGDEVRGVELTGVTDDLDRDDADRG